ncbi:uncharacterized protein LY89DRAFT_679522 [Mollisia scopiformis]|uniref:Uncharacterized protein n=1 Tax=Mollisia scopiformis TaxID=149040 RepID=A0A194XWG5_MOLSC|nr:uncharacterized protein LY89DRAFT_679522 [Mollisia scopiformis]KUJ24364.1 hypothetical protein LY89DRAFT_679522 [Mollisia scopiformis]
MASVSEADSLRAKGNTFYKSGNLLKAIELYQRAFNLEPSNSAALGNLSAAQYELGEYKKCVETAERRCPY